MPNLGMVHADAETGVMQIVDTFKTVRFNYENIIMNNWNLKIILVSQVPVLWIQELTKVM
jgi:hypothetical protein